MSKKKTRKRIIKPPVPRVSTSFDCPYCSNKRNKKLGVANLTCKKCSEAKGTNIPIKNPIDIYCKWLDECVDLNNKKELGEEDLY